VNRAAGGFKVGAFSFSPFAILTGLGVFLIGYFVTRWFQRWLDGTVMARGRVDPGVRNSIRTVVGYAGLAIALLIAVSAAGFNLSNIAIIAGGLSLGIGFGLQNIVSNFVSGLILLAERPFKVGDWIETGATSGIVKKISVRATEIETFQRQTVIMPNSTFINGAVMNWTHRNKLGRIEVPFGVVYASDPKQVHDSALAIVRAHPMVLRNPEPAVLFQGFTDIAMSFEARAFLADISNGGTVRNDLRTSLVEGFRVQGIILATTLNPQPAAQQPGGVGQAKSKK
jgi:small-conductance mechanosensitive channel